MRPDDPASMNNLAFLLAETGDNLDEALKLARDSLAKAPAEASFSDTLGYVYLKRDQKDNALEIFNGLVRKYPGDPTFAYHLGLALFEKGDKTRAKAEFARAMGQRPTPEIETSIQDLLLRMQ
jgi:predicted Zn-dependent protease